MGLVIFPKYILHYNMRPVVDQACFTELEVIQDELQPVIANRRGSLLVTEVLRVDLDVHTRHYLLHLPLSCAMYNGEHRLTRTLRIIGLILAVSTKVAVQNSPKL